MDCACLRPDGEYLDTKDCCLSCHAAVLHITFMSFDRCPSLPCCCSWDPECVQEMDKLTGSVRVFARAKPEDAAGRDVQTV